VYLILNSNLHFPIVFVKFTQKTMNQG